MPPPKSTNKTPPKKTPTKHFVLVKYSAVKHPRSSLEILATEAGAFFFTAKRVKGGNHRLFFWKTQRQWTCHAHVGQCYTCSQLYTLVFALVAIVFPYKGDLPQFRLAEKPEDCCKSRCEIELWWFSCCGRRSTDLSQMRRTLDLLTWFMLGPTGETTETMISTCSSTCWCPGLELFYFDLHFDVEREQRFSADLEFDMVGGEAVRSSR